MSGCTDQKRRLIEPDHPAINVLRQCELLGLGRSSYYYQPVPLTESNLELELMARIDQAYTKWPFYGVRRMLVVIRQAGFAAGPKLVRRLMRKMGLEAVYPHRSASQPALGAVKYPYLLSGVTVARPDQVWSSDITYVRMRRGFVYLVVVMDWYSRCVLNWEVSTSLEAAFCVATLERCLRRGQPAIFNSDQGAQYTSAAFTGVLREAGVAISMDGRGRVFDNIFVERLWRSVKYEEVYLKDYETVAEAVTSLGRYFEFYNRERPHQSLGYRTPADVYHAWAN